MENENKIVISPLTKTVDEVSDLVWGDADKTYVLCILKLSDGSTIPFSAHSNDIEEHGKQLYENIVDGQYGKIAKFKTSKTDEKVVDPLEKLKSFLAANPDVQELLK